MASHRGHHSSTAGTSTAEPPQDWRKRAACRDIPTEFFYPEGRGRDLALAREDAKTFCREQCPVLEQCREASRGERHGVWGGLDEADRGYDPRGIRRKVVAQ